VQKVWLVSLFLAGQKVESNYKNLPAMPLINRGACQSTRKMPEKMAKKKRDKINKLRPGAHLILHLAHKKFAIKITILIFYQKNSTSFSEFSLRYSS
jgi:hypothetical protein